ncbi:5199_t:CDS:10 [Diversispora eburnea]|uniref:5199_t:CDS:1 n=1 Tax=Diversispora eburnea TaxID=1213867 RepID=A0A9N8VWS1_9GLOM|nr:5199_t:CDS:10 [Diversispora eburnea]
MRELPSRESAQFKHILKYYEFKQYKRGLKAAEQILKKYSEHGGWHVYGLLHRSDKNYGEALKCYTNALKIDKDNMQILQDYSLLQIQMRNYEAYNESRHHLLQLRSNNQRYWIGLAISYHLLENYETAEKVLKAYEGTLKEKPSPMNFEYSELLLYHNLILEESGNIKAALEHLESIKEETCDRRTWKEKRAQFLLKLDRFQEAEEAYLELIDDNPDCYSYYEGLHQAKKFNVNSNNLTPEEEEKIITIYKELSQKYPKSNAIKRFPLQYITERFKTLVDEYIRAALRKGVPSLFVNLKNFYDNPQKEEIIEQLVEGYLQCLKKYDNTKALKSIDEAIEHTPTLVELYMTKGRILKCTKYMLRNNQPIEAENTIGLFTRGDAPDPITDLMEMQCMWFALEEADCYFKFNKLGKALKRLHQIEKVTLRAYLSMLRLEDQLRSHPYYVRSATIAIKIYLKLYDNPKTAALDNDDQDYANMTEAERKKAKSKAKKAALKKQKEDDEKKEKSKDDQKKRIEKPLDDDPEGEKLLKTDDPLGEAFKFLMPLQELSSKRIETHLLGFEIYLRKKKYLLALRALLQAYKIDKENATLHKDIIRFKLEVSSNISKIHSTTIQVITEELTSKILPEDMTLIKFSEEFIERNKNSIEHLLVGAESFYLIDSSKKQETGNLLLKVYDEKYNETRTLQLGYDIGG